MKSVLFIFLLILSPLFADDRLDVDHESLQTIVNRVASKIDRKAEFIKEICQTLRAKEDVVLIFREKYHELRQKLSKSWPFLLELDELTKTLPQPESLFPLERRRSIIAEPNTVNMQPFTILLKNLHTIQTMLEFVPAYPIYIRDAANQTLEFQKKWGDLISKTQASLGSNSFHKADLLDIFLEVKYFHKYLESFKEALKHRKYALGVHFDSFVESHRSISAMESTLAYIFQKRVKALYNLLFSILHHEVINLPNSPQDLETEFFQDTQRFIENMSDAVVVYVPGPNTAQACEQLSKEIGEAFKVPDNWVAIVEGFQKEALMLLEYHSITLQLHQLTTFYRNFETRFSRACTTDLNEAFRLLTPTASLTLPGLPPFRIPQTMARTIFNFDVPDALLFTDPSEPTNPQPTSLVDHLLFQRMDKSASSSFEQENLYSWLAELFGLPMEPTVVVSCDRLTPGGPTPGFFKVMRQQPSSVLALLHRIGRGEITFKKSVDSQSVGSLLLFNILTSAGLGPESLMSVNGGLRLASYGHLLEPQFDTSRRPGTEKLVHEFVGRNICNLLPVMKEIILNEVKSEFFSDDILIILVHALIQLSKNLDEYDAFVKKHNIPSDKARVYGLVLKNQVNTIKRLVQNFKSMQQVAKTSGVTYWQVLESLRPHEAFCYAQILSDAERCVHKSQIFFQDLFPLMIQHLRKTFEDAQLRGYPSLFSQVQLDALTEGAEAYSAAINRYVQEYSTQKAKYEKEWEAILVDHQNARSEFAESDEDMTQKTQDLSILRQLLPPSGLTEDSYAERLSALAGRLPGDSDVVTLVKERQEREQSQKDERELVKIQEDVERLIRISHREAKALAAEIKKDTVRWNQLSAENNQETTKFLAQFQQYKAIFKNLSKRLNENVTFANISKELGRGVPRDVNDFLFRQFNWAEENETFDAHVIMKAWEMMDDQENPIIFENFDTAPQIDWAGIPLLQEAVDHPASLKDVLDDLILNADVSGREPDSALTIVTPLLKLCPNPTKYHASWDSLWARTSVAFLALPPNVATFFQTKGLKRDAEKETLLREQRRQLARYATLSSQVLQAPTGPKGTPEQRACYHFRILWGGSDPVSEGLKEALLLPENSPVGVLPDPADDPGSIGFSSCSKSDGGIFAYHRLEPKLVPKSGKHITLFSSHSILPAKARRALATHVYPVLYLQWLADVKKFAPALNFHPWFIKTLCEKSFLVQEIVTSDSTLTFQGILSRLWSEIYYILEIGFKNNGNAERFLKSEENVTISSSAYTVDFDWRAHPTSQNLQTLLSDWRNIFSQKSLTPRLTLDHAASVILSYFDPALYDLEILNAVLNVATNFNLRFSQIKPEYWSDPKILTYLANQNASVKVIELAASLRRGLPVSIQRSSTTFLISGIMGDTKLLCELLELFPTDGISHLTLNNNHLRALKDIIPSLSKFKMPTGFGLNLKDNPLHNFAPLASLGGKLTELHVNNTGIPAEYTLDDLHPLIYPPSNPESAKAKPLRETLRDKYYNTSTPAMTQRLAGDVVTLWNNVQELIRAPVPSLEDRDIIICIIEKLAEKHWDEALEGPSIEKPPLSLSLDAVFQLLQPPYFPRESAFKLIYSLKNGLSVGTKPYFLRFRKGIFTNGLSDLEQLKISKVKVSSSFLSALPKFSNLQYLILTYNNQPAVLDDLPPLPNLLLLDLSYNQIESLMGLHTLLQETKFKNLQYFIVSHNNLTSGSHPSFNGLRLLLELSDLKTVDLKYNELTASPPFGTKNLEHLVLGGNYIPGLSDQRERESQH